MLGEFGDAYAMCMYVHFNFQTKHLHGSMWWWKCGYVVSMYMGLVLELVHGMFMHSAM